LQLITSLVGQEFAHFRYLGPLRDEPKPVYSIATSAEPSHVGYKGEYTAAVLDLYQNQMIQCVLPDDLARVRKAYLSDAVRAWLSYFEIAERFYTQEEGQLGHRLFIFPGDVKRRMDLTNVGVGVSQVLPIVVMALISEPGTILLFEQPELHLHPKVQSLLADFFLAVSRTGRQCIVETHSEYLVNRLRLRVAESEWGSGLADQIALYFVERQQGTSNFRSVAIDEYGAIEDWPDGFFDQGPSEAERILMSAAKKHANRGTHAD
jgi:predicted ATPase